MPVFKVYYGNGEGGGFFMVKKRFKAEQIVLMLREAEVQLAKGLDLDQVCHNLGFSTHSYYR